jgi:acyl-CoA synthetase (AMP-forming)/AMP-acid ligase II
MKKTKSKKFKRSPFVDSVAIRAKYFPDYVPAVVYGDTKINWGELYVNICRLANALKDKVKVQRGDTIAFIFHNTPQFLEINFAIQMLGAVPVPVNYRYVPSEIEYTLNDCDAVALLCEEDIINEVIEIMDKVPKVKLFVVDAEIPPDGFVRYKDLINYPKKKEIKVPVDENDTGVIIYTGGTTGRSKGVMLTNRNLLTNQEGIIRSLLYSLPKIDLACIKYGANISEIKFLKAFDLFNSYFESYFENNKDGAISLDMIGSDIMPDLAVTIVEREEKIKIMIGAPNEEELSIRIVAKLDEQFGTLLNLLPLVYTKKGRRRAVLKMLKLILVRKIKLKGGFHQIKEFTKSLLKTSKAKTDEDRLNEFLSLLIAPPMFHLAGYAFFLMFSTYAGGICVLPREKSFNAEQILGMIDKHRPKWLFLVPTMYKEGMAYITENPNHPYDLSSVRIALSGAALLKGEDKKKLLTLLPNALVMDAFGQTEMAAISSIKIDADPSNIHHGSVGRLSPGIEAKIMRDDGTECDESEIGEIYYRGKTTMKGYYGDEEKTSRTIDDEGWLHSGDLGYLKDGELYTVDRKGECINTGAEKVFPIEVEEVLHEHPAIKDICIIGIPDEKWGNKIRAVVVLKEGKTLAEKELIDWCVGKMAGYKKPRSVVFIEEMPISPVGKVQRGKIRKAYGQPKVND